MQPWPMKPSMDPERSLRRPCRGSLVESVEILDAASGPIVAVVSSPEDGLAAYEIIVERERLNWRVIATRLSSER